MLDLDPWNSGPGLMGFYTWTSRALDPHFWISGPAVLELYLWNFGPGILEFWSWTSGLLDLDLDFWTSGILEWSRRLEFWTWTIGILELEFWNAGPGLHERGEGTVGGA